MPVLRVEGLDKPVLIVILPKLELSEILQWITQIMSLKI